MIRDASDIPTDDDSFQFDRNESPAMFSHPSRRLSDLDLDNEVHRLQRMLKQISEDFLNKRKQLEEDCCQELKQLNVNADKTHRLQQDLEKGGTASSHARSDQSLLDYAELLVECRSLKQENEALTEQYLLAELENFEINSYYEQILVEERAKVAHYQSIYTDKLRLLHQPSPSPPAIPDDD